MKSRILMLLASSAAVTALVIPHRLVAQCQAKHDPKQTHYLVKALTTLGGTQGGANTVNDNGFVMGWATLPGDQTEHGVLWRDQTTTDLGTLGGPNSVKLSWHEYQRRACGQLSDLGSIMIMCDSRDLTLHALF
jgi:probable HAF family extracellular repeat protein